MQKKDQIPPLTALRGLAVYWVYMFHDFFITSPGGFLDYLHRYGYYGVDIFFILSGFIISHTHQKEFSTLGQVKANSGRFLWLRFARIYPLHLFVLVMMDIFYRLGIYNGPSNNAFIASQIDNPVSFFYNLVLLQSNLPSGNALTWNIISWFISVLWILYLGFPLFTWAVATRLKNPLWNLALLAAAIGFWICYICPNCSLTFFPHSLNDTSCRIPRGILEFIMGIAMYNLYSMGFLKRLPWDVLALCSLGGIFLIMYLKSSGMDVEDVFLILDFIVLIYSLAFARGIAYRLFSLKPLMYLGTISYSFYMIHWVCMVIMLFKVVFPYFPEPSYSVPVYVVMTAVLLALASACYHFIELPVRKHMDKMFPRPKT